MWFKKNQKCPNHSIPLSYSTTEIIFYAERHPETMANFEVQMIYYGFYILAYKFISRKPMS